MAVPFYLRYGDSEIPLPLGELLVGRASDCDLVLNDHMVSRHHAKLSVGVTGAFVEDLESANGLFVNGSRIQIKVRLRAGDQIVIGSQCLWLESAGQTNKRSRAATSSQLPTMSYAQSRSPDAPPRPELADEVTKRGDILALLTGVADKMVAMGKTKQAEQILSVRLREILQEAQAGRKVPPEASEFAAQQATRLAQLTGNAAWVDYVFELYARIPRLLPADVVESLYSLLREVPPIRLDLLRSYLSALGQISSSFGPGDRFLINRIQGLEGLAASR